MKKLKFMNISIDNLSMEEALNEIDSLLNNGKYNYLVTPNVDHIVKLEKDKEFQEVYKNADLVLTDGMPLVWVSKLYNTPIKEKVSGSDLFPNICELAARKGYSIFLLGAGPGVADKAAENLMKKYIGLKVAGTYSPKFGFENDIDEINSIINIINSASPNILAVGLGAPKQEKFIYKYKEKLKVPIAIAIGASIDFEAGEVRRAPLWMQNIGLEWFYRLIKEPKRMFKRYLIEDLRFFKLIFKYRNRR